jgi:transcriptional regulator with GAF, ATPase, and Fis domain
MRSHLVAALECDRPLGGSLRIELDGLASAVVGRALDQRWERTIESSDGTLTLRLPARAMSSVHARIAREGADWVATDLRSTNGMLVNGRACQRRRLEPGDVLELGHTLFVFTGELWTPEGTPPVEERGVTPSNEGISTLLPGLRRALDETERWARAALPVLVRGETGTGKELVAQSIHVQSGRDGPLVPVNCAALPSSLLESQLFGHTRGAFSGAIRDEAGLVRSAEGGTLFLDEIGDLPLAAQGALLRVLQEGEVVAVGAARPVRVDVRFVAATHRDLAAMVAAGTFRGDLLARIDGATVHLPPLRERRADLGILVGTLLQRIAGRSGTTCQLEPQAALAMSAYAWPANVRELEQCLRRAVAAADDRIGVQHLPPAVVAALDRFHTLPPASSEKTPGLREALVLHLRAQNGNVAAVSRAFDKAPAQIHRWMKRLGLNPNDYRDGRREAEGS